MSTSRTRRSKPEQARDILLSLLKDQEAREARLKAEYEEATNGTYRTRRAIELLDQAMPLGLAPTANFAINISPDPINIVTDFTVEPVSVTTNVDTSRHLPFPPQRIGEKPLGISDVWEPKDGYATVHTALMYERQETCALCRAGVPFATEERTAHHVIIRSEDDVERGFWRPPCTGIEKEAE